MNQERFEIIKILGKGRTGGVYEAEDLLTHQKVALRRFFSVSGDTDVSGWKDVFIALAQNLVQIQHPALMAIYSADVDEDGAFISMELLEAGQTIEERIEARGHLSNEEFYVMANNLLDAFSQIHYKGLCHGGLSGRSVMQVPVHSGGIIYKLVDLGMPSLIPIINPSLPALAAGDPALTAPELFEGQKPDARSDVYMLGHLFYLSLAGGHPLAGIPIEEAQQKHKLHKFSSLSGYRSSVPKDIVEWIEYLTQADPCARPQSAYEALESMPFHDFSSINGQYRDSTASVSGTAAGAPVGKVTGRTNLSQTRLDSPNSYDPTAKNGSKVGIVIVSLAACLVLALGTGLVVLLQDQQRSKQAGRGEKTTVSVGSNKSLTKTSEKPKGSLQEVQLNKEKKKEEYLKKAKQAEQKMLSRITYLEPQLLLKQESINNVAARGPVLQLDQALTWYVRGKEGLVTRDETKLDLLFEEDLSVSNIENVGMTLISDQQEWFSSEGFLFAEDTVLPELLFRYTAADFIGDIKARLYFRAKNIQLYAGAGVNPGLKSGKSSRALNILPGLSYVDIEVASVKKFERVALDFRVGGKVTKGKPAEFIPIAFLLYDEFPDPIESGSFDPEQGPKLAKETDRKPDPSKDQEQNQKPVVDSKLKKEAAPADRKELALEDDQEVDDEWIDGVKVTVNEDGTNTIELKPLPPRQP